MTASVSNNDLDKLALETDARQGERMLALVHSFLGRFISYPNEYAHVAHTLWCVHCHLMDRWESTPRLAFLSAEPESGKTRALEITELLVPNPVQAVNVSPSYLLRKVGSEEGATILFDEIDTVFGPKAKDNEELRGLLNAGHRRGAVAGRCAVKGKEMVPEEIPAYAAVALAGLGWLPDTILSRSVIIRMRRRHPGERVESYRRRLHRPEGDAIRDIIVGWARSVGRLVTCGDSTSLRSAPGVADVSTARGPCRFRQRDVTRAIRAAFAGGAVRAQVQVGDILITAEKTVDGDAILSDGGNEWDAPPSEKGRAR
jgi:Protein of unknown function (DUF3631)